MYKNNNLQFLVLFGEEKVNFDSKADNESGYIKKNNGYLYIWSGGADLHNNYYTKVDLTNYKTLNIIGNISAVNTVTGSLYISEKENAFYNSETVKYLQLGTEIAKYTMDVSDLYGEYYVGLYGSNRYVRLYDMWLEK